MNILIIGFTIIILVSSIMKILNTIYVGKLAKENQSKKVCLINPRVSYEQFRKVSKESSVLSSPIRTKGDFMDFIIDSISLDDNAG